MQYHIKLVIVSSGGPKPGMKGATVILLVWVAFLLGIIIFWIKAGCTNIDIWPGAMRMVGWRLLDFKCGFGSMSIMTLRHVPLHYCGHRCVCGPQSWLQPEHPNHPDNLRWRQKVLSQALQKLYISRKRFRGITSQPAFCR